MADGLKWDPILKENNNDEFGRSVDLSDAGNRIAIGAPETTDQTQMLGMSVFLNGTEQPGYKWGMISMGKTG